MEEGDVEVPEVFDVFVVGENLLGTVEVDHVDPAGLSVVAESVGERVVRQLNIPTTVQLQQEVWLVLDDSIEDVLVRQAGGQLGHQLVLGHGPPDVAPLDAAEPL